MNEIAEAFAKEGIVEFANNGGTPKVESQQPSQQTPTVEAQSDVVVLDEPQGTVANDPHKEPDYDSWLNGKFGKNAEALQAELQELGTLREIKNADPYKSPLGKQFDILVAQGTKPEDAVRYLTADETKLSNKDYLVFEAQRTFPDADPTRITRNIDKKYGIGEFAPKKDDGEGNMIVDTEAEKDNIFAMEMDAQNAKKNFKTLREELVKPHTPREQVEQKGKEQQRVASWQPHLKKITQEFKEFKIPLGKDKEGKPIVTLKSNVKNFDGAILDKFIQDNNIQPNEEGFKQLDDFKENVYFLQNRADILWKTAEWARSQNDKEWQARIHNPNLKAPNSADFGGSKNKSKSDQYADAFDRVLK